MTMKQGWFIAGVIVVLLGTASLLVYAEPRHPDACWQLTPYQDVLEVTVDANSATSYETHLRWDAWYLYTLHGGGMAVTSIDGGVAGWQATFRNTSSSAFSGHPVCTFQATVGLAPGEGLFKGSWGLQCSAKPQTPTFQVSGTLTPITCLGAPVQVARAFGIAVSVHQADAPERHQGPAGYAAQD